jgi:phosphoglycolate phosphatase-like HAD superfamily hydrolase
MSPISDFVGVDLDGTLIDARKRQIAVAQSFISKLSDVPLKAEDFWNLKRDGLNTQAALENLGYSNEMAREISYRWIREIEQSRWLRIDEWLPLAREGLQMLKEHGVEIRVITARTKSKNLLRQVSTLGLNNWINRLDIVDPLRAAESKSQILNGAIAFIGDSESDALAARLAGVPFVAVTTGQRSRAFLEHCHVDTITDDFSVAASTVLTIWNSR